MLLNDTQHYTYGAYARKSSESEDRQIQSIERQVDELLEVKNKEQLILFDKPIEESKSAFSIGREGFSKLIKLTEQGKINAWLCWHANRLSRNPIDAGIIIHLMDLGKLDHIRTPTRIYFNTPTDKMMLQIEFTMSKKDSDDKSLFVKSGLEKRYKKGFPTGKAPIGYLNDKTKEKGNRDWLVDDERFEKLRLVFKRFLKGNDSISSITDYAKNVLYLDTQKVKYIGGKPVGRSLMEHILKNPVYAGFFHSLNKNGKQTTKRELHKGVPRLISENEHIRILQILRSRVHPKLQKHSTLYQGLIKSPKGETIGADLKFQLICDCKHKFSYRNKENCPRCGIPIDDMEHPKYLSYTYYYNIKRRKNKMTSSKSIEETKVEEYLLNYLKENLYVHPFLCDWAKKHLKEMNVLLVNHEIEKTELQEKQLRALRAQKERLLSIYAKGHLEEDSYVKEAQKVDMDIQQLEKRTETNDWVSVIERYLDFGKECVAIFENGDFEDKRALLEEMSSNLIWNEENLNVFNDIGLKGFINMLRQIKSKYQQFEPGKPDGFKGSKALFDTTCPIMLRLLDNLRTCFLSHKGFRDGWYG